MIPLYDLLSICGLLHFAFADDLFVFGAWSLTMPGGVYRPGDQYADSSSDDDKYNDGLFRKLTHCAVGDV